MSATPLSGRAFFLLPDRGNSAESWRWEGGCRLCEPTGSGSHATQNNYNLERDNGHCHKSKGLRTVLWTEFLDVNETKVLRVFLPCHSQSPLLTTVILLPPTPQQKLVETDLHVYEFGFSIQNITRNCEHFCFTKSVFLRQQINFQIDKTYTNAVCKNIATYAKNTLFFFLKTCLRHFLVKRIFQPRLKRILKLIDGCIPAR